MLVTEGHVLKTSTSEGQFNPPKSSMSNKQPRKVQMKCSGHSDL